MYSDLSLIRKHRVNLSLADDEHELIDAFVRYDGRPKAVLLRELILERAQAVLAGEADLAPRLAAMERADPALRRA